MESEEPIRQHLADLFERIDPQCVLDVGANTGQYGRLLREIGYDGWIVSFEPVRSSFEELCETSSGDRHWRAFQLALGSQRGETEIAVADVTQLSSFLRLNSYAADQLPGASRISHTERVQTRTVGDCWDECLADLPQQRVFLKLDTQGWDLHVLEGSRPVLDRIAGAQLEASLVPIYEDQPTFADSLAAVTKLGFAVTGIFPVNRDSLFRLIEVDCVLLNPQHIDADQWHTPTWALNTHACLHQIPAVIPESESFVLIDDGSLGLEDVEGRAAIPFLERDGEYYGRPADGKTATEELKRLTRRGLHHVVIPWMCFWWLDEYPELAGYLASDWHQLSATEAALVFRLSEVVRVD